LEKYITRWSYHLGVIALVLAVVIRAIDVVAPTMSVIPTKGDGIGYKAFMDGAFLCFITTIASACYGWVNSQRSQAFPAENAWNRRDGNSDEIARDFVNSDSAQEIRQ
jgi:hypothetical protein